MKSAVRGEKALRAPSSIFTITRRLASPSAIPEDLNFHLIQGARGTRKFERFLLV